MPAIVSCPACQARLKVPDDSVGLDKVVKCPTCGERINLAEVTGTTTRPVAASAGTRPAARRDDEAVDDDEDRPRSRKDRARDEDDDEEEEDRPRARKSRSRDDDEDDEDRPSRRRRRPRKKAKSGGAGLIIGLVAGGVVLLLLCGGIGVYVLYRMGADAEEMVGAHAVQAHDVPGHDNAPAAPAFIPPEARVAKPAAPPPAVNNPPVAANPPAAASRPPAPSGNLTNDNLLKLKTDTPLADIEAVIGAGTSCTIADVKTALTSPRPSRLGDPAVRVEQNAQRRGVVKWYRWNNGGLSLFLGVDGRDVARVSATLKIEGGTRSTATTSGGSGNLGIATAGPN
jgi:predicted Zn finger-like uncharacterized protein